VLHISGDLTTRCLCCSISKLYIPGACANSRLNNFGITSLNPKQINCKTVENYSQDTCNLVFDQGTCCGPELCRVSVAAAHCCLTFNHAACQCISNPRCVSILCAAPSTAIVSNLTADEFIGARSALSHHFHIPCLFLHPQLHPELQQADAYATNEAVQTLEALLTLQQFACRHRQHLLAR